MSKVSFKFPFDVMAECRITGFKGTIIVRQESINGSIQYGLQPRKNKEDSDYVGDAKSIDEGYVTGTPEVSEEVDFKFDCGDKVRNFINGFEGTITRRKQWLNGCIQYVVEGEVVKTELHGMTTQEHTCWEQELELQKDKAPAKVEKRRTGGPSESFSSMGGV